MYGWRARIGLLIPSPNTTMEPEFNQVVPEGVSVHAERMIHIWKEKEDLNEAVSMMNKDMLRAASAVATIEPNIIVYGCTGGSMLEGIGFDLQQSRLIQENTGIKAITTSTAVMSAFKKMGIKKVAVATPYIKKLNEFEKAFLEGNGFQVLNIKGLGLLPIRIGDKYPNEAYRLAKEVDLPNADGIFISCTDFRTIEIIDMLEQDLGKPVITSNQATIWYTLINLGISKPIKGYGELFLK